MDYADFILSLNTPATRGVDRAIAVLWYAKRVHGLEGMTTREVTTLLEEKCGHPRQNVSRLDTQLKEDKRVARYGRSGWRLHPRAMLAMNEKYSTTIEIPNVSKTMGAGSVIPSDLIRETRRSYLIRVAEQINVSYDHGLYDCTAVMARRLLETLIIEVYEQKGRASEIKHSTNGYFFAFDDLIQFASKDHALNLGRDTIKTLTENKRLGDQSAHNRRFTARRGDVDVLKQGLRIAVEELLHLCSFSPDANIDKSAEVN